MRLWKKIFVGVVAFIIMAVVLYHHQYQTLIDEGSDLADEHCIKVNPLIIDRKNRYIDNYKVMIASGSAEDFQRTLQDYIDVSKKYTDAEYAWVNKDSLFQNRWDFKLIVPSYLKKAAAAQNTKYYNDYLAASAVNAAFLATDSASQKSLSDMVMDYTQKSNQAQDEYNAIFDSPHGFDIRNFFLSTPLSTCPPQNLNIPDVNEFLKNPNPDLGSPNA
jgi:hypothetical protein